METKLVDYEHRFTTLEDQVSTNTKQIKDLEKRQDNLDELVSTVKVLAVREENVEKDVGEIKTDVKSLTGKSGKRWDDLVDKIILLIAGGVIGFILTQLGLG